MPGAGHAVMNSADPAQLLRSHGLLGEAEKPSGRHCGGAGMEEAQPGGRGTEIQVGRCVDGAKIHFQGCLSCGSCI